MASVLSWTQNGAAGEARLRRARWVVLSALSVIVLQMPAFALVGLFNTFATEGLPLWRGGTGTLLSLLLAAITLWHTAERIDHDHDRSVVRYWVMFACLLGTVSLLDLELWSALIAAVWLSVLGATCLHKPVLTTGVVLCVLPWARALFYEDPDWARIALIWAIALGFTVFLFIGNMGILRLWDLSKEVVAGRQAQARLAVSDERLRIARDIHDLLGHSLSGIAIRSQLAAKLTDRDLGRAKAEMISVQASAREALHEVRAAVSGYRDVDPREELEGVREVLTASGVHCEFTGDVETVPGHLAGPVAWLIRESGTNIMRHSVARRCEFAFRLSCDWLVVEISNDGVMTDGTSSEPGLGSGITGLAERLVSVDGTLTAGRSDDGTFLLRAVLPVGSDAVDGPKANDDLKESM